VAAFKMLGDKMKINIVSLILIAPLLLFCNAVMSAYEKVNDCYSLTNKYDQIDCIREKNKESNPLPEFGGKPLMRPENGEDDL
jgi:hypothetical protein